jgi:hypothetical protein
LEMRVGAPISTAGLGIGDMSSLSERVQSSLEALHHSGQA